MKIRGKRGIEKVAVVKCNSYKQKKVDNAVEKALKLIDFKFKKGMKVLIKPNIVGSFPKKQTAVTTSPELIAGVCKILKKNNCKIFIGESSFTLTDDAFKSSGIEKAVKKYGKIVVFEKDKLVRINDKKAKILKRFQISKTLRDIDLVINMPKLKTHILTKYTGAIKNLYGVIPGGMKQRLHLKAKGEKTFSNLLVDIYQNIQPELTVMDGIIGMQGHGPTSGQPRKAGLVIACKNGVALDIACTKIIGLNPKKVYHIKEAVKRRLYPNFKFELVGVSKLPDLHFRMPIKKMHFARLRRLFKEEPIVCDTKKCIKCGLCEKHCPAKAIKLQPYPVVDKKKCIRCFCCIEICPQDAINLKK